MQMGKSSGSKGEKTKNTKAEPIISIDDDSDDESSSGESSDGNVITKTGAVDKSSPNRKADSTSTVKSVAKKPRMEAPSTPKRGVNLSQVVEATTARRHRHGACRRCHPQGNGVPVQGELQYLRLLE